MNAFNRVQSTLGGSDEQPPITASLSPGSGQVPIDPEMVGMIRLRRRAARRHQAQLAQIRRHPDPAEAASGLAQQRAWALRRYHPCAAQQAHLGQGGQVRLQAARHWLRRSARATAPDLASGGGVVVYHRDVPACLGSGPCRA